MGNSEIKLLIKKAAFWKQNLEKEVVSYKNYFTK